MTKQEGAVATRLACLGHVIVYRFGVPNAPDQLQSLTHLKSQPPYLIAERQLLSVSCAFFEMRNKRFLCVLSKIPFSCAFLLWCILGFITTVMQWQYVWSVFHGLCKTCTFYFVEKLQRSTLSQWLELYITLLDPWCLLPVVPSIDLLLSMPKYYIHQMSSTSHKLVNTLGHRTPALSPPMI